MADILLKRDSNLAATYVPNTFIDEYMTHADGEFVKIYLYLLRCMDNPDTACSISDIADKFDHTEKDVKRALKYWEKMQLLRLEFNSEEELTGICLTDHASSSVPLLVAETPAYRSPAPKLAKAVYTTVLAGESAAKPQPPAPARTEYTAEQMLMFQNDETVQELLFVAERYMGRPLNNTEIQSILYWLDQLKFSQDLIDYLIEQCVAKNHKSFRYMDKIAIDWAEQGIRTLAEAKQDTGSHNHAVHAVQKAFGISGRNLVGYELEFVQKWSKSMGFSDEVITLACQRTIRSAHQISFEYADSILMNWKKQDVHSVKDISLLDARYQEAKNAAGRQAASRTAAKPSASGFTNFTQRTYDYEELERELLASAR